MCIFITAALPAKANVEAIRKAMGAPDDVLRPLANARVLARIEAGAGYYRALQQWCDCQVVLGSRGDSSDQPDDTEHEYAKRRKKGWGEAKLARWLETRKRLADARHQGAGAYNDRAIVWWNRLIECSLREGGARWMALLRHFGGDPASEDVVWKREQRIALADVTGDLLLDLEEDVLYRFEAPRARAR